MTDIYPPSRLDQGDGDPLPMPRPDGPLAPATPDMTTPPPHDDLAAHFACTVINARRLIKTEF